MRIENLHLFEKHLEELKSQKFGPLYCIFGKDPFECQEAVDRLLRALMPAPGQRDLALTQFDGSEVGEAELAEALQSLSFFSKLKVIWIQHVDKLKKSMQERLIDYFSRPAPAQVLVLSGSGWQKNMVIYKAADSAGWILEFPECKPWEKEQRTAEWVNQRVSATRKLMAYPVCQFLVQRIGCEHATLAQEIEKLMCYVGERKEITRQDIETLCHRQPSESIWQLGEAIFRKDAPAALMGVHALLSEGLPLLPLLRQIRSQFQTEYQICLLMAQGKQAQDITQEFPYLKGQILEKHMRQARQYGSTAFQRGLLAIDEAELRIKNSSMDDNLIIELLILRLT